MALRAARWRHSMCSIRSVWPFILCYLRICVTYRKSTVEKICQCSVTICAVAEHGIISKEEDRSIDRSIEWNTEKKCSPFWLYIASHFLLGVGSMECVRTAHADNKKTICQPSRAIYLFSRPTSLIDRLHHIRTYMAVNTCIRPPNERLTNNYRLISYSIFLQFVAWVTIVDTVRCNSKILGKLNKTIRLYSKKGRTKTTESHIKLQLSINFSFHYSNCDKIKAHSLVDGKREFLE